MKRLLLTFLMLGFVTQTVSVKAYQVLTPEKRMNAAFERTFSEDVKNGIKVIAALGVAGIGAYGFSSLCCALNLNIDDSLVLGLMFSSLVSLGYITYQEYIQKKDSIEKELVTPPCYVKRICYIEQNSF